jgi:hypothetical protein
VVTAGYVAGGMSDGPEVVDKDVESRESFKIGTPDH